MEKYEPKGFVISPEDLKKLEKSNQIKPTIIDVVQTMKDQIKNCGYKPTITILSFKVKVKSFKVRNKTIHSQIKRVVKLFQRKFKNTTIDRIEYRIGLDGDDFVNDMNTVEFLFQVH